jgi:hypothetical protein
LQPPWTVELGDLTVLTAKIDALSSETATALCAALKTLLKDGTSATG